MKCCLVRITPLIFDWSGGVFASLSYVRRSLDRAVPNPGFALGCRGLGGCSGPALVRRAGVNRAFQATKKTPRLCAEVSDLIY